MSNTLDLDAAREAWERVLRELQLQMTRATFDAWLRGSRAVALEGKAMTVAVRHARALDWVEGRLRPVIERTVKRVVGPGATVEFVAFPGGAEAGDRGEARGKEGAGKGRAGGEKGRAPGKQGGTRDLAWTDFYIKCKVAFRQRALRALKGCKLSVFLCLALHVDRHGVARPGIESIMRETGYSRGAVCSALDELEALGLVTKTAGGRGTDQYQVQGYAWFGKQAAPSLWEEQPPPV